MIMMDIPGELHGTTPLVPHKFHALGRYVAGNLAAGDGLSLTGALVGHCTL